MTRRTLLAAVAVAILVVAGIVALRTIGGPSTESSTSASTAGRVVHRERSGDLEIALLTPTGTLTAGRNAFTIEFRAVSNRALVDVGTARASANMPMPGMVMPGNVQVTPTGVPGRYEGTAEFGMAGAWQMAIEWDGPAGRGSVKFEGAVQ